MTPDTEARPEEPRTEDCEHENIVTYTGPQAGTLWACEDCRRRFYPACPTCVDVGHRNVEHPPQPVPNGLDVERLAEALYWTLAEVPTDWHGEGEQRVYLRHARTILARLSKSPDTEARPDEPRTENRDLLTVRGALAGLRIDIEDHEWQDADREFVEHLTRTAVRGIEASSRLVPESEVREVPSGLDANPWLDRLVRAERENHCGDAACMTRRVSAAIRVLTGGKEHQDYCWAVETFEVEMRVRDPETVGAEPSNAMLDAALAALTPAQPVPSGLDKAIEDAITLLEAAPAHNWGPGEPDETIEALRRLATATPSPSQPVPSGLDELREAAQAVLVELDIIRRHWNTTSKAMLVHRDTQEALRSALGGSNR